MLGPLSGVRRRPPAVRSTRGRRHRTRSMTGFELAVELDEKGRGSRETLRLDGGAALQGTAAILRFIARSGGAAAEHLVRSCSYLAPAAPGQPDLSRAGAGF